MKDLITEAREIASDMLGADYERAETRAIDIITKLCDALEKAEEQNKQLIREVSALAAESVKRDVTLARLEAEVEVALGKGCDYCGLIYAIHAESYGIEDLDCANEPIDNKFCPMCGKKLPVYAGTIGGEIVQHALKELGAEEGAEHERD